ncbi:hypothetical protein H1R16_07070 [Marnyiella aurantia]|uniref:Uncharacterized protein n=1 Tax=Marnyiella aurantia TaxID=2758037 RepID=A0A7D7QXD3_9FLAO|nr:hypothetical protein [Marnyiella aurantia]MBA5247180.1 hypothetical protein [Marnyiella aurantia]MBP0613205.1 hypothetical protein [Marnyiella aurantia]QMS97491.1 hypothetical protein H1R16_07070 [Marnyiella aurantia]
MKQIVRMILLGAVTVLTGAGIMVRGTEESGFMYNTIMAVGMLIMAYAFFLLYGFRRRKA